MIARASSTALPATHVAGAPGAQGIASAQAFGRIVGPITAISGVLLLVELVLQGLGVLVRPGAVAG